MSAKKVTMSERIRRKDGKGREATPSVPQWNEWMGPWQRVKTHALFRPGGEKKGDSLAHLNGQIGWMAWHDRWDMWLIVNGTALKRRKGRNEV